MIISFSKLGNYGRLGNQLFEIAGVLGLAEKYNADARFPAWAYEKYFTIQLSHGQAASKQVKEKHFHHHDWQLTGDVDVLGYFQSEKYFPSYNVFEFKDDFKQSVKNKVPPEMWDKPTICFQIRRGDYVGNPNYYQLSIEYYIDALLTNFPDWRNYNIVFFSDEINYCKVHFECLPNAFFCENLNDIEQLCLATMIDHFIIPNSSFGWWCAWLGEKAHSKIIHCGHLQAGKLLEHNDPKDYWPERWIRHEKPSYKINLPDVSFTIPVYYDHEDRVKNLRLSLCMIQKSFESEVIIMEEGNNRFEFTSEWCKYIQVDNHVFHRTKMLNDMAVMTSKKIIFNYDCDVIMPPMQIYLCVEALRAGADFVYPYDGRFARMDRHTWFSVIEKYTDIGMAAGHSFLGKGSKAMAETSVGGCVAYTKKAFIKSGMENEYMVSFAPEDVERWERWHRLEYRIERISGSLFHMNHFIGPNSSTRHKYYDANVNELAKMRLMDKQTMLDYIKTWPWCHQYTEEYYKEISEGSRVSAAIVFSELNLKVKSVVDVGSGMGAWVQTGIKWMCIDYNLPYAPEGAEYIEHDLSKSMPPVIKCDLALCVEVAEHLPIEVADDLVKYLCECSDKILFSAAIPYQGGQGHINEQWQTWWAELFEKNGFGGSNIQMPHPVEYWYRQNLVLYEKGKKNKVVDYVLPEYYEQKMSSYDTHL